MPNKYEDTYLFEAFLDAEGRYYDYGTSFIEGDNVVDTNKTGMTFYDQFFDVKDRAYLQDVKNLKGTIVRMNPEEYYDKCAVDIFSVPVSKLKKERGEMDRKIIEKLKTIMTKYNRRMCMPMINYADKGQEGLHRMMAIAELYGWDHKVPVLVVEWYDKERADKDEQEEKIKRVETVINRAIKRAQEYKYVNYDQFKDQLQFTLDQEFEYSNDVEPPVQFNFIDLNDEEFEVQIGPASVTFWKDDIQLKPQETEEDIVDDIDEEDIDDFLLRYLGPDYETEFPDVKKKLMKENYKHNLTTKRKVRYNENDISPFGYQVDFFKDGEKVGTASICGVGTDDPYLYDFVVEPSQRGKGYANDMMQHMIDEYDALHLYVDKDNYKAINLYKKFGWNIVGEAPEQEGQKPGWEMGRFETDYKPQLEENLYTDIRSKVEKGWSKETCHPAYVDKWNFSNRSAGQCAVTAMYINQKYGYDIYETMVGRSRHFFNVTSDGNIIDVTCDQFPVEPVDYSASRKREFKDLYRSCKDRYELFVKNLEDRQLNESVENIDRQTIINALENANHSYYMNTSMICEIICEDLYYNHNIDARYRGRTIYIGTDRIATIDVSKDGPNLVGMIGYKLFI